MTHSDDPRAGVPDLFATLEDLQDARAGSMADAVAAGWIEAIAAARSGGGTTSIEVLRAIVCTEARLALSRFTTEIVLVTASESAPELADAPEESRAPATGPAAVRREDGSVEVDLAKLRGGGANPELKPDPNRPSGRPDARS